MCPSDVAGASCLSAFLVWVILSVVSLFLRLLSSHFCKLECVSVMLCTSSAAWSYEFITLRARHAHPAALSGYQDTCTNRRGAPGQTASFWPDCWLVDQNIQSCHTIFSFVHTVFGCGTSMFSAKSVATSLVMQKCRRRHLRLGKCGFVHCTLQLLLSPEWPL